MYMIGPHQKQAHSFTLS